MRRCCHRHRLVVVAIAAVVALAGCDVRTVVTVDVEDDGSGTVTVAVGLDEEALAQLPDLDQNGSGNARDLVQMARVDDLAATGWQVADASTDDDGVTWIKASKPFGTPQQAAEVLAEVTGPNGPLRDFAFERDTSFGREQFSFSGTADLSGGLAALSDEGLAAALDGMPLGEDPAAIEERLGKPLAEMVHLDFEVKLPGADAEKWSPVLGGEAVEMETTSTVNDLRVLGLAALSIACALALGTVFLLRRARY